MRKIVCGELYDVIIVLKAKGNEKMHYNIFSIHYGIMDYSYPVYFIDHLQKVIRNLVNCLRSIIAGSTLSAAVYIFKQYHYINVLMRFSTKICMLFLLHFVFIAFCFKTRFFTFSHVCLILLHYK